MKKNRWFLRGMAAVALVLVMTFAAYASAPKTPAFDVAFISAQAIDIKIIGEEENSGHNFLMLYVKTDSIPDKTTVGKICDFLQRNYIPFGVDLDTIQEIDDAQFTTDLGFGKWGGGHPVYEKWYGRDLNWHCLQYDENFYVMKGMWPAVFYKVKISNDRPSQANVFVF